MAPCGRCRQFLFDYFPRIEVVLGPAEAPRTVPVASLLPDAYVWADHQE